ncbi:MAG: HpaII family restriction endonuclease [Bacteroidales bacterium]
MQLKANKQEWAKAYAIFRLIGAGNLAKGNRHQQPVEDENLRLLRLTRYEGEGSLKITRYSDEITAVLNGIEKKIPLQRFSELADRLLLLLKGKEEEFICPEAETLLDELGIFDFNPSALEGEDFEAVFFNEKTECEEFRRIRIKSNLSNLYLVAANRASNFKYDITQVKFSNPETNKINAIGDNETGSILRLDEIFRLGGKLKFTGTEGKFFLSALQLIDMQLPKLLAEMIRNFYTTDLLTVRDLTEELNRNNPFKVKDEMIEKSRVYEYKIRQFLYAAACGMKPTKTWRGNGYNHTHLFITKKGELLSYDPNEKENFEKFLFFNTRFSLPNEDKNKFGSIEKENGQWLIKLNLEIRFI